MTKFLLYILFFVQPLFCHEVFAEGSKDLYPAGVRGHRAFLISRTAQYRDTNYPFPTIGTHYVYVKAGETLAAASSAIYMNFGHITITKPDGTVLTRSSFEGIEDGDYTVGLIASRGGGTRRAELAGPRTGYRPWEIKAAPGEGGIWKVDFGAPERVIDNTQQVQSVLADQDWVQDNSVAIAAWDISVRDVNDQNWIDGRVYTNVMGLHVNSNYMSNANGAFYGVNYVLTKDGFIYKVDGNGSNGIAWTYFVNNKGFLNMSGHPLYQSVSNVFQIMTWGVHDPRAADTDLLVTHKIMYNLPDMTMPQTATGAVPNGQTWLITPKADAEIDNIRLESIEGADAQITTKGARIYFDTNLRSTYQIQIRSESADHPFSSRNIIIEGEPGTNTVYWDGRDADGNMVPIGDGYPITIAIELLGGEVHFPYIDMEINPRGILISRYLDDMTATADATVYWDDSQIPNGASGESSAPQVNLQGIPSQTNGHRWGTYRDQTVESTQANNNNLNYGGFSYGNNMAMDTWSYSLSVSESSKPKITVQVADLLIKSVTADKTEIDLDEQVTYTVVVRNDGPSDAENAKFNYQLPEGFIIHQVVQHSECGEADHVNYTNHVLNANVTLPNGCEMTFVITASAHRVADNVYGYYTTNTNVLRPSGVTDPDATSSDINLNEPGDAATECAATNGKCNNILLHDKVFLLEPYDERGQISMVKSGFHIDGNENGYHEAGEQIRYDFVIRNNGQVVVSNLELRDTLLSTDVLPLAERIFSPGQEIRFSYPYTITAADIAHGQIVNSATILGQNPREFDVRDTSGVTHDDNRETVTPLFQRPKIQLKKTVANQGTGESNQFTVDDEINYSFEIRNEENIIFTDVRLEDPQLYIVPETTITLAPNQSTTTYGTYTVTIGDIRQGEVVNMAWVTGVDPRNNKPFRISSGTDFSNTDATVTTLAKPPLAVHDAYSVYMNSDATFFPLENDISGSSSIDRGTIVILAGPASGQVNVSADGSVRYMPNEDFVGEDSFTYRFRDASRLYSNDTTVHIQVIRTEMIAVDDYFSFDYQTQIMADVLKNDYTVGGSSIDANTVQITIHPMNGQIVVNQNGIVNYKPNENFSGVDYFSYRVQDSNGIWSEEGRVTVVAGGSKIPNVITPNGDGYNDIFQIIGDYRYQRLALDIVDRFGNTVYTSEDYQHDWAAEGCPDGTYYYILRGYSEGKQIMTKKGTVTVIRNIVLN